MKDNVKSKTTIFTSVLLAAILICLGILGGAYALEKKASPPADEPSTPYQQSSSGISQKAGDAIIYEKVELRQYEGEDGHPYIHEISINNTDKTITGFQRGMLAFDKDGNPLKIDWWNLDTNYDPSFHYLYAEDGIKLIPGERNDESGGFSLNFMGNDPEASKIAHVLYCIKEVTFEDGTVWQNPDYEQWRSAFEGKKTDVDFLNNYYPKAFCINGAAAPQKAVDLTGKSKDYRLIAEMSQLDQTVNISEYKRQINSLTTKTGKNLFSLIADASDEIHQGDPLYSYFTTTLSHTSSEQFADVMGGDERSHSFGYSERSRYGAYPVHEDHYTDKEWALVQEQGPEIVYLVGASYVIFYDIIDQKTVTPAERDYLISSVKNDMQIFMNGLDETELGRTGLENKIIQELSRITQKYSNDRIKLQGELQLMDYIGEIPRPY